MSAWIHTFPSEIRSKGTIKVYLPVNSYPQTGRIVEYLVFFFIKSYILKQQQQQQKLWPIEILI